MFFSPYVAIKHFTSSIPHVAEAAFPSNRHHVLQNSPDDILFSVVCYRSCSVKLLFKGETVVISSAALVCSQTDKPSCTNWQRRKKKRIWDAWKWHCCTLMLLNFDCCLFTAALYTLEFKNRFVVVQEM